MQLDQSLIQPHLDAHPYPLLFVTVSGAHLYGFESPDSDYDLRGCHITPVRALIGLDTPDDTHEVMDKSGRLDIDLVTHDARKFFTLLLKNNGYVLEQVCSPLVVHSTPEFEELRALASRCVTKHHKHHFLSFGMSQWGLVVKGGRPTVKGLLYTYRVLLAGIRLLNTGVVESNLRRLNEEFRLSYIDDLIAMKVSGREKDELVGQSLATHEVEYQKLCQQLEAARDRSSLPEVPSCRREIDELLVRVRMKHLG
jgi:uncharacterized protein